MREASGGARPTRFAMNRLPVALGLLLLAAPLPAAAPAGDFEDHADVGKPARAGAAAYDPDRRSYLVSGGGKNMWGREDAFHFAWKRLSGDVALAADVRWV